MKGLSGAFILDPAIMSSSTVRLSTDNLGGFVICEEGRHATNAESMAR